MKKFILLFFLFLPYMLFAQFKIGMTAGANIGKFGGVAPKDASYALRNGLNVGAVIGYRINEDFTLTVQPAYIQRGSDIEVGQDTFFDSLRVYQVKVDFLTLPFFVRIDSDNRITYFISGLEFGIPLTSSLKYEDESMDISSYLNKIDILATIGMGLRFSVGKPDLMIEFRYYQGLLNFNSDKTQTDELHFENFKNIGFQITAGLEWEL
jgi:hypothetical protein